MIVGVGEERLFGLNLGVVFGTVITEVDKKKIYCMVIMEYFFVVGTSEDVGTTVRFPLWENCEDFLVEVFVDFGDWDGIGSGLNFIYAEGAVIFELIEDTFGDVGPEFDEGRVVLMMRGDFEDVVVTAEFVTTPYVGKFSEMGCYPFFGGFVFGGEVATGHFLVTFGRGVEHIRAFAFGGEDFVVFKDLDHAD